MNRVLVGFDGSEGSEQALNRAVLMIDEEGELILLAVVPTPSEQSFIDVNIYNDLKNKAENLIGDVKEDLKSRDFKLRGIVEEGEDAAAKIIDVANRLKVDLIVLGSRGESKLGPYRIGSVANKVVQYAHKPVMVVR